jgi:hypothetical protein
MQHRISNGSSLLLEIHPAGGGYWISHHGYSPTKNGRQ